MSNLFYLYLAAIFAGSGFLFTGIAGALNEYTVLGYTEKIGQEKEVSTGLMHSLTMEKEENNKLVYRLGNAVSSFNNLAIEHKADIEMTSWGDVYTRRVKVEAEHE